MIQGSLRHGIAIEDGTQLLLAGVVGVALGLSFAYLPATYVAITILAIFLIILAIRSPQYAIVMILFIHSTVISGDTLPRLSVGGINIWISDLIIIGLFGLIFVRLLIDRNFRMLRSPVTLPLFLFLLWALISSLRGYFYLDNSRNDVVIETRIILYYSIIFCIMYLIRSENNIKFLLKWFYFLAVVASVFMLVQFVLGVQVSFLTSGKIYSFSTSGGPVVARVQGTVGEGLVTLALILKTVTMFIDKFRFKRVIDLVQWLILAAGLVTTFNRTHWIMIFLALLIAAFFVGEREKRRIFLWGLIVLFMMIFAGTFTVLLSPNSRAASLVYAGIGRVSTIVQEESYTDPNTSTIIWRNFEYGYGIPQIYKNPVMGIGLGAQYRPTLPEDHPGFTGERYTHNSNLWIAMKTGLVGFLLYVWLQFAFILHALKKWRQISSISHRGFVLGGALGIFVVLLGANLHPFGISLEWVPVISLVIGLGESINFNNSLKMEKQE